MVGAKDIRILSLIALTGSLAYSQMHLGTALSFAALIREMK